MTESVQFVSSPLRLDEAVLLNRNGAEKQMLKFNAEIRRLLSAQLRDIRRQRQLDLRTVSKATKINSATIDNLELERNLPNWRLYERLLNYYKVKIRIRLEEEN